ncbi:MAG: energy-coupling factor transporter transmembrane protein EcfT [Chloroflexi bacterium]|nr:energy-coupling factor transporter transmembrane protein EcfT [Chloroflexota bacterium]
MIRFASLDRWATQGASWLHRASPVAKWALLGSAVLLAILAREPWPLLAGYAVLVLAVASCRLPVGTLVLVSLLPVPMFGLVALSRWNGDVNVPLTIVAKGTLTAMAGIVVAATTPYPDLLAPATRVLPAVVADSLVLTYRALFLLVARVEAFRLALQARGGVFGRPAPGALPWPARGTTWRRRFALAATGAAMTVVRAVDVSTRLYDVMRLRGYHGRLSPTRPLAPRRADWRPLILALGLVALGVAARL